MSVAVDMCRIKSALPTTLCHDVGNPAATDNNQTPRRHAFDWFSTDLRWPGSQRKYMPGRCFRYDGRR